MQSIAMLQNRSIRTSYFSNARCYGKTHPQARGRALCRHTAGRNSACSAHSSHVDCEPSTSGSDTAAELEGAWQLLRTFTQKQFRGMAHELLATASQRQALRDALLLVHQSPCPAVSWSPGGAPGVLIGVCASDVRIAVRALRDWCDALQLEYIPPKSRIAGMDDITKVQGHVYIKYYESQAGYLSEYFGRDRGVLLQLGQEQLGHFPLGLWDEAMVKPPPQL